MVWQMVVYTAHMVLHTSTLSTYNDINPPTQTVSEIEGRPHSVETAIEALEYISVAILSIMVLEIGFTILVVGCKAWLSVLHVLDLAVVVASLTLEVVLKSQPDLRQTLSLLIIVRLWTVVRLFESMHEANELAHAAERRKEEEEMKRLRDEVRRLGGDGVGGASGDKGCAENEEPPTRVTIAVADDTTHDDNNL